MTDLQQAMAKNNHSETGVQTDLQKAIAKNNMGNTGSPSQQESISQQPKVDPMQNPKLDPFSELDRWSNPFTQEGRDANSKMIGNAYEQVTDGDWTLEDAAKDFAGGAIKSVGDVGEMASSMYNLTPAGMGRGMYNLATGNTGSTNDIEKLTQPITSSVQEAGVDMADDPEGAMFAVGNLSGAGEGSVIKGAQALSKIPTPTPFKNAALERVIKQSDKSPSEIANITEGIDDIDDQILAVGMAGKENTIGAVAKGVANEGDDAIRALNKESKKRVADINNIADTKDLKKVADETNNMFDKMVETVAKGNENTYDATTILDDLTAVSKLTARSDMSERTVKSLTEKLEANPNLSLSDALNYRKEINAELKTAKGDNYDLWKKMKDNIDGFIADNTDPRMKEFIDDSIDTWAKTKTNEELAEIISKNTSKQGNAVNWEKTAIDLEKAGLYTDEAKASLELAKDYTAKFGNDYSLTSSMSTKGAPEGGSGLLGVMSAIVKGVTKVGEDIIRTNGAKDRGIQEAMVRSLLKKSDTPQEFASELIKSKGTPKNIRDALAKHLKATKRIAKEPTENVAKPVVDRTVEKSLIKSRRDRNQAQNTMDKAQDKTDKINDDIFNIKNKLDIAEEKGLDTAELEIRLARKENDLDRASKDLEIKTDKHSEVSNKFDKEVKDSGYEIDETGEFKHPSQASPRGNVTKKGASTKPKDNSPISKLKEEVKEPNTPIKTLKNDVDSKKSSVDSLASKKEAYKPIDDLVNKKEDVKVDTGSDEYGKAMEEAENTRPKSNSKIMTINGEDIKKTDFDLIQRYQKTRDFNRKNPDKKRPIPKKQIDAYTKHSDVADNMLDVEFKQGDSLDTRGDDVF